ncbi:ATP-binding protein [Nereida sp. MMG025]|uniref:sensor histidine kinase n=1 Tax=Nereida sp. MMG025 TaxID=2909981 RepID=UPI001F1FE3ED|nr:ATP-binding protein [Nereida sp. MMG025]MCF6445370.1 ATP-binding protein [Nereida sp. MMG025]
MTRVMTSRWMLIAAVLALATVLAAGVYRISLSQGMSQLSKRGQADLRLAADRLTTQLQAYAQLAVLLTEHPQVRAELAIGYGEPSNFLRQTADKTTSFAIAVLDAQGREVTHTGAPRLQLDHRNKPYFIRAMTGALGSYHLVGAQGERLFLYAAPVFSSSGPAIGAVLIAVDIEGVESGWRGDTAAVFFRDELDVVFVTNRSELVMRRFGAGEATQALTAEYADADLLPFPPVTPQVMSGHEVWEMDFGPYIPPRALHLVQPLPVIGMQGEALIDVAPVMRLAQLQAGFAAALCLVFGLGLVMAMERRRVLALANAQLEGRVTRRTEELEKLNMDLRAQVAERQEAEAALRRAQSDLVQAGKMSALGQMSAGISHELNQPLMAIGSFAENGRAFLDKGDTATARDNLGRIAELSRRAGRIIKNLRAFARNESEPLEDVNLVDVVSEALAIAEPRLSAEAIKLDWTPPNHPVITRAGQVRMQQVLVNLISNAADAMADKERRVLTITLSGGDGQAVLKVRDTGTGLEAPDKLFEPFYTTKDIGAANGMGLGLSISYGLIQSFDGQIMGRNHPQGGAEFTIHLPLSEASLAA